jgi:dihydropteroate synthase
VLARFLVPVSRLQLKMILKRMGVMNVTPNSFSDGGELDTPKSLLNKFQKFSKVDAIDIGAESTAPMNHSLSWEEEWKRLSPFIKTLGEFKVPISIDTYHPETIFLMAQIWLDEGHQAPLIWNDVSGKFDSSVEEFLELHKNFQYVYCHNLAPSRALSGKHMDHISKIEGIEFLNELAQHFVPFKRDRVIFDPTLGFSKSYEQNWLILNHFEKLQELVGHDQWLLGFSRKSFLRKKLGIDKMTPESREKLDSFHQSILKELKQRVQGELWIRTHRPELIDQI